MFRVLGTDDSVNSCECCGKSNLKYTVIVENNGEVLHYGSVCATRHTGYTDKEIKNTIKDELSARKERAKREYQATQEYLLSEAKIKQAHQLKLSPLDFRKFCKEVTDKADEKYKEIYAKHNLF